MTPDGRVLVSDPSDRINVYASDGSVIESWTLPRGSRGGLSFSGSLTLTTTGDVFVRARQIPRMPGDAVRSGMHRVGPDGPVGEMAWMPELDYERLRAGTAERSVSVPFSPAQISAFTPSGAWIVGVSDDYSFEIYHADGSVVRVRRYWEPIPVHPDEADYVKRARIASMRQRDPEWTWSGPEVPATKPAYYAFFPDQSGRVMVSREGPSRRVEDCDETFEIREDGARPRPCWELAYRIRDVFDLEGNYLGELEFPDTGETAPPRDRRVEEAVSSGQVLHVGLDALFD